MFRDNLPKPGNTTKINVLITDGGLGDLACSLVPVKYMLDNMFWLNPQIFVPDYLFDFAKNVLPSKAKIFRYSEASRYYKEKLPAVSTQWKTNHTAMRTHPVDYAFHMLLDKTPTPEERNYLKVSPVDISVFNLPTKYVCIGVGHTNRTKEFKPDVVNGIVTYCLSMGYLPVFLGKKEEPTGHEKLGLKAEISNDIDYTKGLDFTGKTTILEAASIINGAKCYIGMDGGLVHIAGFTDVPIIAGYTFVNPNHIMPIRNDILGHNVQNIVPPPSLGCRFCQTNWSMFYDHSFFDCYYDDFECVKQLTLDKWIEKLENVL